MALLFQELCKLESSNKLSDYTEGLRLRIRVIFFHFSFLFLVLFCMFTFSDSTGARILDFDICMDDEVWYGVIGNLGHCSYSFLYLSIFCQFKMNLSYFSQ